MSSEPDPLLLALRALPPRPVPPEARDRAADAGRAAFVRAFDRTPWYRVDGAITPRHDGALALASRGVVPVLLAGVVGLYLFWAFAAAIALNQ